MAVKDGNTVRVHYTGTFSDGEVFDSSREREPLEFTIGDGSLIPGFEDALLGHNAGDRFTVTIPADEAYGEHLEELLMEVPVSEVPEDIKPEVGMMLQIATDDGDMEVQIDLYHEWDRPEGTAEPEKVPCIQGHPSGVNGTKKGHPQQRMSLKNGGAEGT